jgi:hypothetical protein
MGQLYIGWRVRMTPGHLKSLLRVLVLAWLSAAAACAPARWPDGTPALVYLTWQGDPTTTMSVQWLSADGVTGEGVTFGRTGDARRQAVTAERSPFPHSDRVLHVAELTGLEPGCDYRFRIDGLSGEYGFRTLPDDTTRPVTFIVGGDVHRRRSVDERMFRVAAGRDPLFVVLGGDIAYGNGDPGRVGRWYEFLDVWQRRMVTSDGRLVPLVAAIGNHEVKGQFDRTPDEAPFFYALFPGTAPDGRQVLDCGDALSIILLDSGHTHPVAGEQSAWLADALAARSGVPHLFVVYHAPAYPSVRRFHGGQGPAIRRHWVPLFERYGVDVVYEHHEHAYKRTPLILDGAVSPQGVLYLGDGGWGVPPRGVHRPRNTWYLDRAESINNIIVTTVNGANRSHTALSPDGAVIDFYR